MSSGPNHGLRSYAHQQPQAILVYTQANSLDGGNNTYCADETRRVSIISWLPSHIAILYLRQSSLSHVFPLELLRKEFLNIPVSELVQCNATRFACIPVINNFQI